MARIPKGLNRDELLTAALEGLESQKKRIDQQIVEVRGLLGKRSVRLNGTLEALAMTAAVTHTHRELSPEARERIASAQRKRWKEYRRKKKAAETQQV